MNGKRLGLGLALLAPILGGCAASDTGPSFGNVGRNFASDWTNARLFDRATLAESRGDTLAIASAGEKLNASIARGNREAIPIAQAWINARLSEALTQDDLAQVASSEAETVQLRKDANRSYRAALAFLPDDERARRALDAGTLNALGYHLAERGQTRADFQTAERLTSLAIELSPTRNSFERWSRAHGPQDSHAWALFRLGRTKEALEAQERVLETIREEGKHGLPNAEVVYHMGAIYRVAGLETDARAAFKNALELGPTPELRATLEASLDGQVT